MAAVTVADALVARLDAHTAADPSFWDFAHVAKRSHAHALFPYPAMMVPELQGTLLDDLTAADPTVEWCYDPFAGSGTVLTESMRRGLGFIGSDLNPFAVLIMSVKARALAPSTLSRATTRVLAAARGWDDVEPVTFPSRDKWFAHDISRQLSCLHHAIKAERHLAVRQFLWVCMAATVRLVSNSRTSTFKLHLYPADVLRTRRHDAHQVFASVAAESIDQLSQQHGELSGAGRLVRGHYTGRIDVRQGDALHDATFPSGLKADVLMTSPPYGDNRTTVPYGQHSFLPLRWIDRADLPTPDVEELVANPYRLDVASMGGRRVPDHARTLADLSARSQAVAEAAAALKGLDGNGVHRLLAFCADLDSAIATITTRLRPGAIQFWTLGNRRISGVHIATSTIVEQLSAARGTTSLRTLTRRFPRNAKRMASRNDSVPLMDAEQILVLRTAMKSHPPTDGLQGKLSLS